MVTVGSLIVTAILSTCAAEDLESKEEEVRNLLVTSQVDSLHVINCTCERKHREYILQRCSSNYTLLASLRLVFKWDLIVMSLPTGHDQCPGPADVPGLVHQVHPHFPLYCFMFVNDARAVLSHAHATTWNLISYSWFRIVLEITWGSQKKFFWEPPKYIFQTRFTTSELKWAQRNVPEWELWGGGKLTIAVQSGQRLFEEDYKTNTVIAD